MLYYIESKKILSVIRCPCNFRNIPLVCFINPYNLYFIYQDNTFGFILDTDFYDTSIFCTHKRKMKWNKWVKLFFNLLHKVWTFQITVVLRVINSHLSFPDRIILCDIKILVIGLSLKQKKTKNSIFFSSLKTVVFASPISL